MNEFELIARIAPTLPGNAQLVKGVGDDCAVLDLGIKDRLVIFKTDAVVEDVHFTSEVSGARVGHKALGRVLSDAAAMAATPTACLITLGLPLHFRPEYVTALYEGINSLARAFQVAVAGGETTRVPGKTFISVSLVGLIPRGRVLGRSGARPGDAIFVTGELGGSRSGKHLDFTPRVIEGQWLAENFPIHSMIDLSDGLAGDLRHILRNSKTGAELLAKAVPISRAARLQARGESSSKPPLLAALTDGEDFELLFTLPSKHAVTLVDEWKKRFAGTRLSCIGRITPEPGLRIKDERGIRELAAHGYTHFQKS